MREGWEIRKLGDIASYTSGSRPTGGVGGIKEGALSLGGEHIGKNGWLDLTSPKYVEQDYYVANPKGHINDNDILLCKDGALTGKVAIVRDELVGKKAMVNEHVFIIRSSMVGQQCLYYFLFSPTGQTALKARITGAAQGGINGSNLKTILVPVPPIAVQEKIVAELDCLTGIIEKKKQQLNELDKLAQSIFYDMFGDPISNDKGWEMKKLKDVAEIVGGSTPKTNVEEYWNGQNPWVAPAELHQNHYISSTERGISNEAAKGLTLLPVGTVLLSSRAPIGKVSITTIPMYCNQGFKNVVCSNALNNEYVYHLLLNKNEYLNSLGTGATFKEISKKTTENIAIAVPPIELQEAFAAQSRAIEKQKELVKRSIVETETLFNSRMDYWFN